MGTPRIIYGTAWKKERSTELVLTAIRAGFRAIDTANQLKHYDEVRVGAGIASSGVPREQLWLQTKFTHVDGQDLRGYMPYDPKAPMAQRVASSIAASLEHLRTPYIDSYVLHGPMCGGPTIHPLDVEAWGEMERAVGRGVVRQLGVSNINAAQLADMLRNPAIAIKPACVQNRCYAARAWDADVRALCAAHGIAYQGFSLLTANPQVVGAPSVMAVAGGRGWTPEQAVLRMAADMGMVVLTGTTSAAHMAQDLAAIAAPPLTEAERRQLGMR